MSRGIHLFSSNTPGYGLSERKCLPCSGILGRSTPSYSYHGNYNPFSGFKVQMSKNLVYGSKRASLSCKASSSSHRRNPDFSRQNKQGHGFSRGKNRQNQESDNSEEETDILSSKSGPILSLSGTPKFQATVTPGPREKEIVELFRKIQAQLRERAAIKVEKRIEALQGQEERGTVDSLLKLLRKHSADQKKSGSEEFNLDQPERNNSFNTEQNLNFLDANSIATEEIQEPSVAPFTRPASNFRRKSPVPRVKYQPIYSVDENIASISLPKSQGKKKKSIVEPDPEPVSLDVHDEPLDEVSESSDVLEVYDEIVEPSAAENTDINSLKLSELRVLAKSRGVKGYSKLKKSELVELLSEATS
ncbi:rho termination factor [Tasmannia lanceolata]|uniref:rho termination factor n=1 Tax=Tasmannia lanceolata TaxID=3420 RepID=UPI00406482A3